MKRFPITPLAVGLALASFASPASAQTEKNVDLHVSPRWEECSFQLDPSLTEPAWRRFTEEAGLVTYFRPLMDAKPLGAGHFEVAALQWTTNIDDTSDAWNDTFVHPNATHWLFEGSGLAFPGLAARAGVSEKVDVGAYFTKNPNANYGFYGGQLQYELAGSAKKAWAACARASFVSLYGPEDVDFTVVGLDALASKEFRVVGDWATVSPYVGVSSYAARSHEKSAVVDLPDQLVGGSQAMVGALARVSRLDLAVEFSTARVRSRSLKVGVSF